MMKKNYYKGLSLFSGAGGLDLGFHKTGMAQTITSYDFNEDAYKTLILNREALCREDVDGDFPRIIQADLSTSSVIDEIIRVHKNVDLVFGGPPCQSFSIMGKKGGVDDPRGALIFSFSRIVEEILPNAFLFENVPHFSKLDNGKIKEAYESKFKQLGYSIWSGILNAADFGALTFRTRFFILGIRGKAQIGPPTPTHSKSKQCNLFLEKQFSPWRSCKKVFDTIADAEGSGERLLNHELVNHSRSTIDRFESLAFGETDNVRKRNRLDPERPAHSLYVGGIIGKLQARTHIHPYLPRELTPRECALIQGFPMNWKFHGKRDSAVHQIANAVPVELAKATCLHLISQLEKLS
jgi:DNA (cytosine-5)-methyltransferase 1